MKTLIEHAWILTMDENFREIRNGWLLVDGERIAALGEGEYAGACDERIDAAGGLLLPGFVNTHCHVSMVPFRTLGDDCPDRLRRFLFPLENEAMTRQLVYLGARYGIAEMLLAGTTAFVDMYYFEDEVARAAQEMGMRGWLGETVIDQKTCDAETAEDGLRRCEELIRAWRGSKLVRGIVAPHGTTTCSGETLRLCHELAAREDTLMTLHMSEMDYEMRFFAQQGKTPTSYMEELGLVDEHLLAAHCIHMTEADLACLKARGARVAHCVGSNTKAGKGVSPVRKMAEMGIPYGLGTDGPSSGNTLSVFDQMRVFALAHKTATRDRSAFPAREIVAAATRGGAEALGAQREIGQLKRGMRADLQIVSLKGPAMFPVYNPYSALVYSANARDVDTVMVNGERLVKSGRLVKADLAALRQALDGPMKPFFAAAAQYSDVL